MRNLTSGPDQLKPFELLEEVDVELDGDVTLLFKDVLLQSTACKYDVEACTSNANRLYKEWMDGYDEAQPDKAT
jgi:hypothetical protein